MSPDVRAAKLRTAHTHAGLSQLPHETRGELGRTPVERGLQQRLGTARMHPHLRMLPGERGDAAAQREPLGHQQGRPRAQPVIRKRRHPEPHVLQRAGRVRLGHYRPRGHASRDEPILEYVRLMGLSNTLRVRRPKLPLTSRREAYPNPCVVEAGRAIRNREIGRSEHEHDVRRTRRHRLAQRRRTADKHPAAGRAQAGSGPSSGSCGPPCIRRRHREKPVQPSAHTPLQQRRIWPEASFRPGTDRKRETACGGTVETANGLEADEQAIRHRGRGQPRSSNHHPGLMADRARRSRADTAR